MITYICYHFTQGLHNDAIVLQEFLKNSYTVKLLSYDETDIYISSSINFDLSNDMVVFLEHINPNYTNSKRIIFFPNYEYLTTKDTEFMNSKVDLICCKTYKTLTYLKNSLKIDGRKLIYTGFISKDRICFSKEKKEIGFLHLKGVSSNKNTETLINTWLLHPDWPLLHIVQQYDYEISKDVNFKNIRITQRKLNENEVEQLMNNYMFHVCPSSCEGFGHYIVEALSTSSVVITSNSPPMNEHVDESFGFLVDITYQKTKKLNSNISLLKTDSLESAIKTALNMNDMVTETYGKKSRKKYCEMKENFEKNIEMIWIFIYNDVMTNL